MNKVTTLNQFIIEQQAGVPQATGGFSCLLHHVGIAAKKVNREVNKAGLVVNGAVLLQKKIRISLFLTMD